MFSSKQLQLGMFFLNIIAGVAFCQWEQIGNLGNYEVKALINFSDGYDQCIYAGTNGGGVFVSKDTGETWLSVNTGLTDLSVTCMVKTSVYGNPVICLGTASGIFRGDGTSWNCVSTSVIASNLIVIGSTIYASTVSGVQKSSDNGSTWNKIGPTLNQNGNISYIQTTALYCFYRGSKFYLIAGTGPDYWGRGTYLDTTGTGGSNWKRISDGDLLLDQASQTTRMVTCFTDVNYTSESTNNNFPVFAGTTRDGIYKVNGGYHGTGTNYWIQANTNLTGYNRYINAIQTFESKIFAGTQAGFVLSTDSGSSWISVNDGHSTTTNVLTFLKKIGSPVINDGYIYAGSSDGKIWKRSSNSFVAPSSSPQLISPSNSATNVSIEPVLKWNRVNLAADYNLQISSTSDFSNLIVNQTGITDSIYQVSGLMNSTIYYWRVKAINDCGESSWSPAYTLTTVIAPPSSPALSSPANNAIDISLSPSLNWNSTADASSYSLQVASSSSFTDYIVNQTGLTETTYDLSSLGNSTQYYWRVNASNIGGTSSWSDTWSFTTVPPAPSAPSLVSPSDLATDIQLNPTLYWNSVSGASSYSVQVSTASDFSTIIANQSGINSTEYIVSDMATSTKHYWRVNATNAGGTSSWSSIWSFTTVPTSPSAPILVSPANDTTNIPVSTTLSWSAASGASSYRVQVSTSSTFSTTIFNQTGITETSYAVSGLSYNTKYYWRVNATNAGGTSPWSLVRNFTSCLSKPILVSPGYNYINIPETFTFKWNRASGATSYQLKIGNDTWVPVIFDQSNISDTFCVVTDLPNNTTLRWKVRASNSLQTSEWSSDGRFAVKLKDVTLFEPPDKSINTDLSVSLEWSTISGAAAYYLQISLVSNFSSTIVNLTNLVNTSYIVSGLSNSTTYYWRVKAVSFLESAWCSPWSFTTVIAAPSTPILSSPGNGTGSVSITPTLSWFPVTGAESYTVQISTVSDFSSLVTSATGLTNTSWSPNGLSYNTVYYWRVNATNLGGTSEWSSGWNFTTIIEQPDIPTQVSPVDAATNVPIQSTFLWNSVSSAASYTLQLSTSELFTSYVLNQNEIADTFYTVSDLTNSTQYYWRVNTTNAGGSSSWSSNRSFTTIIAIPAPPVLVSPANGSTNAALDQILSWNSVSGATEYALQISTKTDFSSLILNQAGISSTEYSISELSTNTTYYWRVNATNTSGSSSWSSAWSFMTIPSPPAAPVLVSPAEAAVDVITNSSLLWNTTMSAITYSVQVSTQTDFSSLIVSQTDITDTSYAFSNMQNSTTYYWRVCATNAGGNGDWSVIRSFTTVIAAPSAPDLLSPENAEISVSVTPAFTWSTVSGAETYSLQISTIQDFSWLVIDQSDISAASFSPPALYHNTEYYWRVNSKNAGGIGLWSSVWSFITVVIPPDLPVIAAPSDEATDVPIAPNLFWNKASGADNYSLQISTSPSFSSLILDQTGITDTSYSTSGLSNSTQYYWRVRSNNSGGSSDWALATFTTLIEIADGPVPISPDSGRVDLATSIVLSWYTAARAAEYYLQVSTNSLFENILIDTNLVDTTLLISELDNSTIYYWRVNAINTGGASSWSKVMSFTTVCSLPPQVILLPLISDTIHTDTVVYKWNIAGQNTTVYNLQIFSDSAMSVLYFNDSSLTDTSFVFRGLSNGNSYWWHVRAGNFAGWGDFSGAAKVIVKIPPVRVLPTAFSVKVIGASLRNGTIEYTLPKHSKVSVVLFDIRGRSLFKFYAIQAAGGYTLNMKKTHFAAGKYFVDFEAGGFRKTVDILIK